MVYSLVDEIDVPPVVEPVQHAPREQSLCFRWQRPALLGQPFHGVPPFAAASCPPAVKLSVALPGVMQLQAEPRQHAAGVHVDRTARTGAAARAGRPRPPEQCVMEPTPAAPTGVRSARVRSLAAPAAPGRAGIRVAWRHQPRQRRSLPVWRGPLHARSSACPPYSPGSPQLKRLNIQIDTLVPLSFVHSTLLKCGRTDSVLIARCCGWILEDYPPESRWWSGVRGCAVGVLQGGLFDCATRS